MESLYVLAAAWQHGVRSIAIRAISDAADSNLPLDFDRVFSERGEVSVPKVIGQVVRRPGLLPGLLRLANESERAAVHTGAIPGRVCSADRIGPVARASQRPRRWPYEPYRHPSRLASESGHAGSGQMRAGVYRGKGRVVVEHVPIPEIGPGEVLFRVAACGICGTDIKKIHHGFINPPQILGHELAGTVVKTGAGVTKFKAGDRVVSFHHIPCGACFYCEKQLYSQCAGYKKVGLTAGFDPSGGGFAQFVRAMPWIVERGMIALPAKV